MTIAERVTARRRGRSEYRVSARADASGNGVVDAAGTPVLFDGGWRSPAEGLPGPSELLAGAFAACVLQNLARSRALMRFRYDEAEVDVVVERQEKPPRFVSVGYTLRVTTDETDRRVAVMHANLRRSGAVFNTLASVCHVRGTVEVVRPG